MTRVRHELITVACPLCNFQGAMRSVKRLANPDDECSKYGDLYGDRTTSEWKICGQCGFVHQNRRPSIPALNAFYAKSEYHQQPHIPDQWYTLAKYLKFAEWYYREKVAFALDRIDIKEGRVFDLGFGHGGILKMLELEGWTTFGVEPDATLFRFAIETLNLQNVHAAIFDEKFDLATNVDLVISNHTMEHVADLDSVMRGMQKIIRPGAYMLTVIPTYYRNRSPLSRQWMNASHYSMFNHNSLGQLSAKNGFEPVAYTYRGWRKEIDDLWYLARYTESTTSPSEFYEDPDEVDFYINIRNPANSILNWPLHGPPTQFIKKRWRKLGFEKAIVKAYSQFGSKRRAA